MKKLITLLLFASAISFAGTPTIDGTFDGVGVWGLAAGVANGMVGWNNVNVDKVYVTYDESYAYFAASFHSGSVPGGWQYVAFAINVGGGGGGACPWGAPAQAFGHANLPDFVLIGRLNGGWAELRNWTGSNWGGGGTNVYPTDITWAGDYSYVEGRVLLSTLGNPASCDVQFYVGGNNSNEHGNFDSCPDDNRMESWNHPTTISNYISNTQLPIQLGSFIGSFVNSNDVTFEWETISEIHNYGFWIQKRAIGSDDFVTIEESFQEAKGEPSTYTWTYANATVDKTEFYLLQQDTDGLTSRFGPIMLNPNDPVESVPAVFALNQNYPNPFNPATTISWQLAVGGYTTLKVYNVLGNEVATLFSGNAEAGKIYNSKFDGSKFSTGLYFYKIQSGNNVEVKKMTLVK